jgi:RNA polymerase sigma-70 factor (ECF subfamily)
MNELEIIRQLKAGDKPALERLMQIYQNYVYTIALRIVKKSALAEEVAQDVFVRVFQKIGSYREESRFSTWLFTIVYRQSLNYLESRASQESSAFVGYDPSTDPDTMHDSQLIFSESDNEWDQLDQRSDLQNILWQAIDQLDQFQGIIISLFYLQELSVQEISGITGIPANSVKTHLHRGRRNLKTILLREYAREDLL